MLCVMCGYSLSPQHTPLLLPAIGVSGVGSIQCSSLVFPLVSYVFISYSVTAPPHPHALTSRDGTSSPCVAGTMLSVSWPDGLALEQGRLKQVVNKVLLQERGEEI